jgi:arabinofuranosyltransferase
MSSSNHGASAPAGRALNPWVVVAPVVVGFVAYFSYLNRNYELDDALIYFRYIRNCLAGHGLVYNAGERFNALTSPLHVYVSLAICFLAGSIRYPMIVMSAVLTMAVALAMFELFRPHEARWPAVAFGAALIAVSRYSYSVYGMETPLFVLLCVACLLLYERRSWFALGIAAALVAMARGEGLLLVAVMGAVHLANRRALPPARDFVLPVLLLGGNAGFNFFYYGALLPHTLMAKVQQGRSGLWGGRWLFFDVAYQLEFFASSRILIAAFVALALLGAIRLGRRELNVIVLGFLAALTMFYVALNVPNYHWYYAPYYAFGCIYAGLGLAEALDLAGRLGVPAWVLGGRLAAALLAAGVLTVQAHATQARPMTNDSRQTVYPRIGAWLAGNTPAESSVAMVEVGIIGYYCERRVVDILGLVSPENAVSLGAGRRDEWLTRDDPDFILVHAPLWPHEDGVIAAVQQGRYRVSDEFDFPGFELLERSGRP